MKTIRIISVVLLTLIPGLILYACVDNRGYTQDIFEEVYDQAFSERVMLPLREDGSVESSHDTGNEVSLLFLGDTSFGETYQEKSGQNSILVRHGYEYPLQNYKSILRDADYVIANLEAPVTDLKVSPYKSRKQYIHRESTVCLPVYELYNFRAFSLANNHTMDYGLTGLYLTLDALEFKGFRYIGAGKQETASVRPLFLNIQTGSTPCKLAVISGYEYRRLYKYLFSWYAEENRGGAQCLESSTVFNMIKYLRETDPDRLIILFPHWGDNYKWKTKHQTMLAKKFVKAGVDLIIGHGAHMFQEIERIKDRWVIYNTGNFMFNSPGRYKKKNAPPYSLIARLIVTGGKGSFPQLRLRLYPVFTDNLVTDYQGRFVDENEFNKVHNFILEKGAQSDKINNSMRVDKDTYGWYYELPVHKISER